MVKVVLVAAISVTVVVVSAVVAVVEVVLVSVLLVAVLVVMTVGALMCAGVVIPVDVPVTMFQVAVDLLSGMICGVLNNINIDVFVDVNSNVFAGVMTAFEFAVSGPLEGFRC